MICDNGKHEYLFIMSSRQIGEVTESFEVKVCAKCGQFNIFGRKNGQPFSVSFILNSSELVDAAGAYLRNMVVELEKMAIRAELEKRLREGEDYG